MNTLIKDIRLWLESRPGIEQIVYLSLILGAAYVVFLVTRKIVIRVLRRLALKSKNKIDDILFEKKVARKLAMIPPILVVNYFSYLVPSVAGIIQRVCLALILWLILSTISSYLHAANEIYEQKKEFEGRPIKGYIQAVTLILYIMGILVIIGILSGQSPLVLLSGVGALTAVLILVFRDTILSFVASLQITSYDLVRLGDWIEAPHFGADGDVIDIALHTIKVQNFDKTIVVIPTHQLLEKSFKNWRGMTEAGGRRIKRSIHIDVNSIKLIDDALKARLDKIQLLEQYLHEKKEEVETYNREHGIDPGSPVNGRRLTNIGTFRAYIELFLKNNQKIDQDFTFLVRQLQPGPTGLPIEIYVFSGDTRWIKYEGIQADIFDHLFAVVREFDLKVFQYPTQSAWLPDKVD